jgi:uncharacterized protein DUF3631
MINFWKRIMNKPASPDQSVALPNGESPEQLYYRLARFFHQYLDLGAEQAGIISIWVFHTHCFFTARTTPYLNICSHEKQSGKTLCLELLNMVCADPWLATGISPSALAKRIAKSRPTVLLDECQTVFGSSDKQVRGLFVSGARCSGIYEGPTAVNVFCPKAFAGMGILPPAIDDRSIPIRLSPTTRDQIFKRFVAKQALKDAESLVAGIRQWIDLHIAALHETAAYTRDQFPPELTLRQRDLVEPLLQIADRIGGQVPALVRHCLVKILRQDSTDNCFMQLLSDIRDIFKNHAVDRLPSDDMLLALNTLKTRPWRSWNNGEPMNPRNLGDILKPHGITSRNIRISKDVYKGYRKRDFSPLWDHHLPEKAASVQQ